MNECILFYVAFCTIMVISRQKKARSRDYALLLFRMTSRVLYSAQYHRQHRTLQAFEQFGTLYVHNHDDKYPARPGFEPGTSRLHAPVDTNESSGPAGSDVKQWSFLQLTLTNVGLMLGQRRRRWTNNKPTFGWAEKQQQICTKNSFQQTLPRVLLVEVVIPTIINPCAAQTVHIYYTL